MRITSSATVPGRPPALTSRRAAVLGAVAAGVISAVVLDLRPSRLIPDTSGGLRLGLTFFEAAFHPALEREAAFVPEGSAPLLVTALTAAVATVRYAAAAVAVSLLLGLTIGFFGSRSWWGGESGSRRGPMGSALSPAVRGALFAGARLTATVTRSVHELIWATMLLAAFGLVPAIAVVAIAIPYTGTFAKVFSEILDEAPRGPADVLKAAGATRTRIFLFGILPAAMPELLAYTLYRFECGLRSAAVMGFVGIPTLGYYVRLSFQNLHYGEVWTFLYVLMALVIAFDAWSGALRRRLVVPAR